MRIAVITVLALLSALAAAAGQIELVEPSSVPVGTSEQFITIYGADLGDHVLFSGKAGEFDLEINARIDKGIIVYLPDLVALTPDRYTIYVRGDAGTAGPAYINVFDPLQSLVLLVPDPITVPAVSRAGAVVRYEVWPFGGTDPNPVVSCTKPSGSVFPLGWSIVDCTASNTAGERAEGQVFITVYDDGMPLLKLPEKTRVTAENASGAIVKFDATAFDEIDGDLPVSCTPPSGSTFRIGITTVGCYALDAAFNYAYGEFTVEVENRGFLLLHVPDAVLAEADGADGARVKFEVTADGTDDPAPTIKCDPESGSLFTIGTTSVSCVATDKFGATADGKFEVIVADSTPPVVSKATAKPDVLKPNNEFVPVAVSVEAFDVVDPQPRCWIGNIWANETIADEDWKPISDLEVALRASVSGTQNREYYLSVLCADRYENVSGSEAIVIVSSSTQQTATTPPSTTTTTRRRSAGH